MRSVRCAASKRQVLHDRHVLTWKELLLGIDRDQIHSMLILCGTTAGNLGAILRSSTLLDISAVCILDESGPSKATLDKAFRFSMLEQKSHWDTLVVPIPDTQEETRFLSDLKERGVKLVGMVAAGAANGDCCDLWDLDLSTQRPVAFIFGADEEDGLAFTKETGLKSAFLQRSDPVYNFLALFCSPQNFSVSFEVSPLEFNPFSVDRWSEEIEVQDLDVLASVSMKDFGCAPAPPDTLNLSAAAAIVAYERQRQRCQRYRGDRWWQKLKKWMKNWGKWWDLKVAR